MTTEILSKKCSKCGEIKNISEFSACKDSKDGYCYLCKLCEADYIKEYQQKNKERLAEYRKQYAIKNKGKRKEYRDEYNKKNKEKIAERKKIYYEKNKQKVCEKAKEFRNKNKEYYKKYNKKYREDNRKYLANHASEYKKTEAGKISVANSGHKRRFLKLRASDGTIPENVRYPLTKELQDLLELQNHKCNNCGTHISRELNNIQLDHHFPISKFGSHSIENIVWLCKTCNLTKSNKVPTTLLLI